MTDDHDSEERHPLQALREEFVRVARAEPRSRVRSLLQRRLLVPLAGLALAGGATGLAVAGGIGGDPYPEPQKVRVLWGPNGIYPDCPVEVRESLSPPELNEFNELSDYADTPGYPVQGCPTVEDLEAHPFGAEFELMTELEQTIEQRRAEE